MILLSTSDITFYFSHILPLMGLWSVSINSFIFPWGMLTPTLPHVLDILGLPLGGKDVHSTQTGFLIHIIQTWPRKPISTWSSTGVELLLIGTSLLEPNSPPSMTNCMSSFTIPTLLQGNLGYANTFLFPTNPCWGLEKSRHVCLRPRPTAKGQS